MHHAAYPDVPPDFGNWLAGFVDGEGCFTIARRSSRQGRYQCALRVQLRNDDADVLEEIRKRTGLGTIALRPIRPGHSPNPQVTWQIQNRSDCLRAVELFDAFPLRAKKARDYDLWRQAVLAWVRVRQGGHAILKYNSPHWAEMERLATLLNGGRVYQGGSPHASPVVAPPAELAALFGPDLLDVAER